MQKQIEDKVIKTEKVDWKSFRFLQPDGFKDINKQQFQKLKTSIINNDFVETFKVWQDDEGVIWCLDGFHRCKALDSLQEDGYAVPDKFTASFVQCRDSKDAAKKVLIYSSAYATMTYEGLDEITTTFNIDFEEIKLEIDPVALDMDRFEAGWVGDGQPGAGNDGEDDVPEPPAEPTAKYGDLYLLGGRHRLLCGNCENAEELERLLNGGNVDLVLSDPPYGINLIKGDIGGLGLSDDKYMRVYNDDKPFDPRYLFRIAQRQILFGANYFSDKLPSSSVGSFGLKAFRIERHANICPF